MADTNYNKMQTPDGKPEPEKPSKVIKGTAKLEKRTPAKKLVNFLFSDKLDSIGTYLTYEVLGPSLRNLAYQLGVGALQMTAKIEQGVHAAVHPLVSAEVEQLSPNPGDLAEATRECAPVRHVPVKDDDARQIGIQAVEQILSRRRPPATDAPKRAR